MPAMTSRSLLTLLATLMIVAGLVFAAQGSGLFPYPAVSVMIDQRPWIWRGLALAVMGLFVLALARRRS